LLFAFETNCHEGNFLKKNKSWIKSKFPFLVDLLIKYQDFRLRLKSPRTVFTEIYQNNYWGDTNSVSGVGSNFEQTEMVRLFLPTLVKDLEIHRLLDVPCGDFFWMKEVDLRSVSYTGGDIVEALIATNLKKYAGENRQFLVLDILQDKIPTSDLIFCRDCFVHFSFKDAFNAIHNFSSSGSKYLAATTFPQRDRNKDILTGQWYPINLQLPPFNFPEPIQIINENFTLKDGAYRDKSLGVWRISDLPSHFAAGNQGH
jgi:hypothetical protein